MITKKDVLKDLTHDHSGNGYVVAQWISADWVRVTENSVPNPNRGRQFFLAWTKKLKPTLRLTDPQNPQSKLAEVPVHPDVVDQVKKIYDDLTAGRAEIRNTRIVYA